MKKLLQLALPTLVAISLSAPLGDTVASATPSAPVLGSKTVITGDAPGYVRVHIPRDLKLKNQWAGGDVSPLRVRGKGRFIGFALVEESSDQGKDIYIGGRLPESAGRRLFIFQLNGLSWAEAPDHRIHRGSYRLYLLPGDGPSKVTLRLPLEEGIKRLSPTEPVFYESRKLKPFPPYSSGLWNVYSAGGTQVLPSKGLLFQAAWFRNSAHVLSQHSACFWVGRPNQPAASTVECGSTELTDPGNLWADETVIDYRSSVGRNIRLYYGSWLPEGAGFERGRFGQTFNLHTASLVEGLDSLGIWLSL